MHEYTSTADQTRGRDHAAGILLAGIAAYPLALASVMTLTIACVQLFT